MADGAIVHKDDQPNTKQQLPLFSLFSKAFPPFIAAPPPPTGASPKPATDVLATCPTPADKYSDEPKRSGVKFIRSTVPPLKLEAENEGRETNPALLWQVYAVGGFFILRWAWARWNERRATRRPSDENPAPKDDYSVTI
ncbi:hypothetical protein RJ639_034802 [Escallonia herrerae]|uniref:Uncharacterized protein n=1 Tax=Escallonia herrerae TaxID=1293975 RepID=A0AA89B9N0_9ASTE|nr:hypothetical protein RJ639_034802 [Escallonia herrerae]